MIIVFDKYTDSTEELRETIQRIDADAKVAALGDDSFSSHGVLSLYDYFIYGREEPREEKKLHFNFLKIPDFWEIRTEGGHGAIYDMGCKKADIYFTEYPYLQRVEWRMEDGWVYKIDYYNKYALKYASEFLDADGNIESKAYYSDRNQEIIVEQPQNDTVTLLECGQVKAFFTSHSQFIEYFLQEAGLDGKRVLIVQDKKGLKLSELHSGGKSLWDCVLFHGRELLEEYIGMGGKNGYRFYSIPKKYPINKAKGEALILTASDRLEEIEYLIRELPEVTFHIAANTQVSNKLFQLGERSNVNVYPQISMQNLNNLWDICDFYLDINYYREIHNAIDTASKKNLLILGFDNTLHCRELVNESCIFPKAEREKFVFAMKELIGHPELVQEKLEKQQVGKLDIVGKMIELMQSGSKNI